MTAVFRSATINSKNVTGNKRKQKSIDLCQENSLWKIVHAGLNMKTEIQELQLAQLSC